jgi:membrane-bound lytic murein transglycosylase D
MENLLMLKTKVTSYLTIAITFCVAGCAHITPMQRNIQHAPKKTVLNKPKATIKDFKKKTEKINLDQAVRDEKISKRDRHFVENRQQNKKVKFWIKYFTTRGRAGFQRFINNGEKYRSIVESTFKKYGLPKDLYYVAIIESGYQNRARSHAGAVGPWQFIKGTALRYGLKVTASIDERKNIYKSTQAAALYFQDLYNIFGSWELALAAYNAGESGIIRRIRGANIRDYYKLSERKIIPKETRHYVPKLIAAMTIIKNPKKYSFYVKPNRFNKFVAAKPINIKNSIGLSKLANKLKISTKVIKELNHDIMKNYIPYQGRKGFDVYVPSRNSKYVANLEEYSKSTKRKSRTKNKVSYTKVNDVKRNNAKIHIVRKNESLFSISKRYNVTLKTIRRLNTLNKNTIYIGQKIKLPGSNKTKAVYSYIVRKGDNLSHVANTFKSNISEIKKLNNMKQSSIYIGQKLTVPAHKKKIYTVKNGDILGSIARKNSVPLKQIKKMNKINNNNIYPGQKIIVAFNIL